MRALFLLRRFHTPVLRSMSGLTTSASALAAQGPGTQDGVWNYLSGDAWHTRFTPATEITSDKGLPTAMPTSGWGHEAGNDSRDLRVRHTIPAPILALTLLATIGCGAARGPVQPFGEEIRSGSLAGTPLGSVIQPGQRVRVATQSGLEEYVVVGMSGDRLQLRSPIGAPDLQIPVDLLERFEVHRGRRVSLLRGLFLGGVAGGLLGGALAFQCTQSHFDCLTSVSPGANAVAGAGIGLAVGLIASLRGGAMWQEVRLSDSSLDRLGGTRLTAQPSATVVAADGAEDVVAITVRNQSGSPITAFAWWEGRGRVALGEVSAGATQTFLAERRASTLALYVRVLTAGPEPRTRPPDARALVRVDTGEAVEWTVLRSGSGFVQDYVRRPR